MASETENREPVHLGEEFIQDPRGVYRRLRRDGPAQPVTMPDGKPGWLVMSYEDARRLLADPRVSKDVTQAVKLFPPGVAGGYSSPLVAGMLNSDPPDHTRLRKLVNKAFTPQAITRLRPRIEQVADELLDAVDDGSVIDLLDAYATPLPIIVICELLGIPAGDRDAFRDATLTFVTMPSEQDAALAGRHLTTYLTSLIAAKRDNPADDLLSRLVEVSDEGSRLTEPEVMNMAVLLLLAGFETTVNLIANGMLALLRNPDQLALLRSDPSLLPGAIEEFLRYGSPLHIATVRFTTEPVRVGETEIPAGQFLHISLLAADSDDDRFAEPDRVDITRQTAGHLAFGHGIHYCLGAPLARLEGEIAIGHLLGRFPDIALDGDPGSLRWRRSTLMHGLYSLPVRTGRF